MAKVYKEVFTNEADYEFWHLENYQAMNGVKECGLRYLDDNQIEVEYINVRG